MKNLPNKEQLAALEAYAKKHGKDWRDKLNQSWYDGTDTPLLRQVRNQFGPCWLGAFKTRHEQIQIVADHYIIAAIWADAPEGTHPRPTAATKREAFRQCEQFIADCNTLFDAAMECFENGYGSHPDCGTAEAAFGHDFWLTRQGHGTGFWDRQELEEGELGDKLAHMARQAGEATYSFYRGWFDLYAEYKK